MTTPERKIRCRVTSVPLRNPCPNPALDEFGVCLKHLEEISAHWADCLAAVAEQIPGEIGATFRSIASTLRKAGS